MKIYRIYQIIMVSIFALIGCSPAQSTYEVDIFPIICDMKPKEEMVFAIDGSIADNAIVTWHADKGTIFSIDPGLNAIFTAPEISGEVKISATVTSGTPLPVLLTRTCLVAATTEVQPTSTKSNVTSLNTSIASATTTFIIPENTVIISEVMANPCGGDKFGKWNDYVELYNYGERPVDVDNWFLTVGGPENKSDMLIAWETRNPNILLNQFVVTNSTQIPAHGFAVVISPTYTQSLDPYRMPYHFPRETLILTIAEGDRIGHSVDGIIGKGTNRDAMVLYVGGARSIREVVSTYGTPILSGYPQDIRDDLVDQLPIDLHICSSAERVNPLGLDTLKNWHEVLNGSPGEAPYP